MGFRKLSTLSMNQVMQRLTLSTSQEDADALSWVVVLKKNFFFLVKVVDN